MGGSVELVLVLLGQHLVHDNDVIVLLGQVDLGLDDEPWAGVALSDHVVGEATEHLD